jgi:hypothetical protein
MKGEAIELIERIQLKVDCRVSFSAYFANNPWLCS